MDRARFDLPSLVGGLSLVVLGVLLLLDLSETLALGFGELAPACLAAAGATLLASGLARRDH